MLVVNIGVWCGIGGAYGVVVDSVSVLQHGVSRVLDVVGS